MLCPVCYSKIKKEHSVCSTCKFNIDELKTASNLAVKQARRERRYDDIIYTSQFPSDLSFKKTFYLAVFGGWFGLHNFYVKRTLKGYFNIVSFFLLFIASVIITLGVMEQEFITVSTYAAFLYAATLLMWVLDLIALVMRSYKVPVVLKKDIKGKIKDDTK